MNFRNVDFFSPAFPFKLKKKPQNSILDERATTTVAETTCAPEQDVQIWQFGLDLANLKCSRKTPLQDSEPCRTFVGNWQRQKYLQTEILWSWGILLHFQRTGPEEQSGCQESHDVFDWGNTHFANRSTFGHNLTSRLQQPRCPLFLPDFDDRYCFLLQIWKLSKCTLPLKRSSHPTPWNLEHTILPLPGTLIMISLRSPPTPLHCR